MEQELLDKMTTEEKQTWFNLALQAENLQLRLYINQLESQSFIDKMKAKYEVKKDDTN